MRVTSYWGCLRAVVLVLWVLYTSVLASAFFHAVPYMFLLTYIQPKLCRKLADEMIGSWIVYYTVGGFKFQQLLYVEKVYVNLNACCIEYFFFRRLTVGPKLQDCACM